MTLTRQLLIDHLENEFGVNPAEINDGTLLFSTGLLDSFSIAELLIFLEEQGGFVIEPTEVTLDNLDSIERILALVRQKTVSG